MQPLTNYEVQDKFIYHIINCIPTGPSSTGQMHLRELHVRCKRHESTRIIMLKKLSKMFKKGPMNSSQSINEFPWENNFFATVKGNM